MRRTTSFLVILATTLGLGCAIKPSPAFEIPMEKYTAPARLAFKNKSVQAEQYLWDFGDGTTSTESDPVHTYNNSGNYTVTLTALKGNKKVLSKQMIQVTAPERCLVSIETPYGTMLAELYNATPQHRDNFLKLAEEQYFDDLLFHRVIKGFMIQGGDPNSRNAPAGQMLGTGGPSYQIPAEFSDDLVHLKGALAAARTNNPEKKSSGSQFYIVQGAPQAEATLRQVEMSKGFNYTLEQREAYLTVGGTPHLDRDYTVFGRVIEGLDILDQIADEETGQGDRPKKDVKMKVRVIK